MRITPSRLAVALLVAASPAWAQGQSRAATTHTVRMLGDEKGYRFEPARLTVSPGDRVRFVMVSGGPHNVQFLEQEIPAAARRALGAGMPDTVAALTSPMYIDAGETYTISLANVPPGDYPYVCTPHQAMNMTGTITVRRGRRPAAR